MSKPDKESSGETQSGTRYDPEVLVAKYGDAQRALATLSEKAERLERDNFKYRDRLREIEKLFPDGVEPDTAIILQQEDADLFDTYKALGSPDEIRTAMTERDEALAQVQRVERDKMVRGVADIVEANAEVLIELSARSESPLEYEVVEETVDGEKQRSVYVKTDNERVAFRQYAEAVWKPFLPSLYPADGETTSTTRRSFIPQEPATPSQGNAPSLSERKRRYRGVL